MVRQGRTAIMLQVAVLVSASLLEVAANFAASYRQSGTVSFLVHLALPAVVVLLLMAVVGDVLVFRMENPAADRPVLNALRVPYPGMSAFSEADAPVYFGRDARIAELIRRLHAVEASEADRFVGVTGASGGGKSSLVHECPATGLARRALMAPLTESHVEVALVGHTATVRAAAWSPDARRIVTASRDGTPPGSGTRPPGPRSTCCAGTTEWSRASHGRRIRARWRGGERVAGLHGADPTPKT
jgi:hypothetical protein